MIIVGTAFVECVGEFAAWRGPVGVNATADGCADDAIESDTARRAHLRALHAVTMRAGVMGQFIGDGAASALQLAPVKRNLK